MCSIQKVSLQLNFNFEMDRELWNNQMSGNLPPELGNLTQIQTL